MTRDEWVVLPVAGWNEPCKVRRDDIGDYWPEPFPEGEGTRVKRRYIDSMFTVKLPLAEFEALLFAPAPAAPDEYTRAGMAWAEAEAAWWHSDLGDIERRHRLHRAAKEAGIAFLRLYRERHGG